jgi:hypothetical protein
MSVMFLVYVIHAFSFYAKASGVGDTHGLAPTTVQSACTFIFCEKIGKAVIETNQLMQIASGDVTERSRRSEESGRM